MPTGEIVSSSWPTGAPELHDAVREGLAALRVPFHTHDMVQVLDIKSLAARCAGSAVVNCPGDNKEKGERATDGAEADTGAAPKRVRFTPIPQNTTSSQEAPLLKRFLANMPPGSLEEIFEKIEQRPSGEAGNCNQASSTGSNESAKTGPAQPAQPAPMTVPRDVDSRMHLPHMYVFPILGFRGAGSSDIAFMEAVQRLYWEIRFTIKAGWAFETSPEANELHGKLTGIAHAE